MRALRLDGPSIGAPPSGPLHRGPSIGEVRLPQGQPTEPAAAMAEQELPSFADLAAGFLRGPPRSTIHERGTTPRPAGFAPGALAGLPSLNDSLTFGALSRALSLSASTCAPSFSALDRLQLGGARLRPPFIRAVLATVPALTTLELRPREVIDVADGGLLDTQLSQLTSLHISCAVVGPALAAELVENTPLLATLSLCRCKQFDAAFAAALRALPSLHRLSLTACACDVEELALVHAVLPDAVEMHVEPCRANSWRRASADTAPVAPYPEYEHASAWVPEAVRADDAAAALWSDELDSAKLSSAKLSDELYSSVDSERDQTQGSSRQMRQMS